MSIYCVLGLCRLLGRYFLLLLLEDRVVIFREFIDGGCVDIDLIT